MGIALWIIVEGARTGMDSRRQFLANIGRQIVPAACSDALQWSADHTPENLRNGPC